MIEKVVIEISGDDKQLQDTLTKLEKLGKVDRENADSFKRTGATHKSALKDSGDEVSRLETKMQNLAERIIAVFAVERIFEWVKETVKAFEEIEQSEKRLGFAVTKVNGESAESFKKLVEQSESLSASLNNLYSPKNIQKAQTMLSNAKFSAKDIMTLLPRILDISATTGRSVDEITEKMILTLNSGRNSLKELGVRFHSTGDVVKDFNNIMKSTEGFVGGAAEQMNTFAGSSQEAENELERLNEVIGSKVTPIWEGLKLSILDALGSLIGINDEMDRFNKKFISQEGRINSFKETYKNFTIAQLEAQAAGESKFAQSDLDKLKEMNDLKGTQIEYTEEEIAAQKKLIAENSYELEAIKQLIEEKKNEHEQTKQSEIDLHKLTMQQLEERLQAVQDAMDANELFEGKNAIGEKKMIEDIKKEIELRQKLAKVAAEAAEKIRKAVEDAHSLWLKSVQENAKKEADEYRALLKEQETDAEKENDTYNERIKNLAKFLEDGLIDEEQYNLMREKEEKRHQDALDKIALEGATKRKGNEDKNMADATKMRQQREQDAVDEAKRENEILQERLDNIKTFADGAIQRYEQILEANISMVDHQEELQKDAITTQRQLAIAGKANDLDFEEKRLNDLEKKRAEEEKKLKKAKELEVFLNSVAEFSKSDPKTAVAKALGQLALVKGAETLFAEKGGLVGNKMARFDGRFHRSGKDKLIVAEEGEGMLSRKDIAMMGGDNAFLDFKKSLSFNFKERGLPISGVMALGMNTKKMEDRLDKIEQAVKNIPGTNIDFEGLYMIVTRDVNGNREITKYVPKTVVGG